MRSWWRRKPRQTTFVYCPTCRFELVAGGHWLGQDTQDPRIEAYRCNRCGRLSVWDFDAPTPLLLEDGLESDRLTTGREAEQ